MRQSLYKGLSFRDILILAFSTMVGWGWISLSGMWVVQGGAVGAALAFVVGAILCIFVGLTYCELTPMLPFAGGELVFSRRAFGYNFSWFTGWIVTFAYLGVAAWEGPALATAIDHLVGIPRVGYLYSVAEFDVYISWLIPAVLVGSLLMYINFKGISVSAKVQAIITLILAVGGVAFAVIGIIQGDSENATPMITGISGVSAVLLSVPAMFVGFDIIPQVAEEMNVPLRKIPKAIIASICLAAGFYIAMIISAAFSAPSAVLSMQGLSVVNATSYATGGVLVSKFIIISAIMGILTSWNGFIIGATRVLYSMGRENMLPKKFGEVHDKYQTPYFAIIFIGLITIFTPLLGQNSLGWFVDASSFGTVIAYLIVALSFIALRIKEPDTERPFKLKYGYVIGVLSVCSATFFLSLYLPFGTSSLNGIEWCIVGVWMLIGCIFYGYINYSRRG